MAEVVLMRRAEARAAHQIPDRAPLRLAVGVEVEVGRRDTAWSRVGRSAAPT
jgi:hypothetical protein